MAELHSLTDYDAKLLLAFGESLKLNKKFTDFLLNNGFPELAALSSAINSDTDALQWLLDNGYPEFAVLSNAIDNEEAAIAWLEKYNCDFLSKFAGACRKEDEAVKWFVANDLQIYIRLIKIIHEILLQQALASDDVHKLRMS